jgi:hypothetical protein
MRALVILALLALSACGPSWAPPNAPAHACETISEAAFNQALDAGAARGDAEIHSSGMVSLNNGPGVVHCTTYNSAMKPCRRPNDYVIRYTTEAGEVLFVRVPANEEYRFDVRARPHTCEILDR